MIPDKKITDEKDQILDLIRKIRNDSALLVSVLWSEEEKKENMDFLVAMDQKMNNLFQSITRNLYWYQKIGWKKFIPNKEMIAKAEMEREIEKEKERLTDWLKDVQSTIYLAFKNQMPEDKLEQTIAMYDVEERKQIQVLDIGCGEGKWLRKFTDWGALPENLTGIEWYDPNIDLAKQHTDSEIRYLKSFPDELPFRDKEFNIILMVGVLMHILGESFRAKIGKELMRVLADDGMIITYNFQKFAEMGFEPFPYLACTMKGLGPEELMNIFPGCHIEWEELSPCGLAIIRKKAE